MTFEAEQYFLLTLDYVNFRIDSLQRMIILENLNWFYAARGKSWSNLKLFQYLQWVKETLDTKLSQTLTGLATEWRLLLTLNIHGHL